MAFRSLTHTDDSSSTASIAVPAGAAVGDIAVIIWGGDSGINPTPPSGFTEKANIVSSDKPQRMVVWWKRLIAADTGSYTCSSAPWSHACLLFSGRVTTGDPFTATGHDPYHG